MMSFRRAATEHVAETTLCLLPATPDGSRGAAKQVGDLVLAEPDIPDHVEEFPLVVREVLGEFMKPGPVGQMIDWFGCVVLRPIDLLSAIPAR